MRPLKRLVLTAAMRPARQSQSHAVFVLSSTTNPLPSHRPSGHESPSRSPAGMRELRSTSRGESPPAASPLTA